MILTNETFIIKSDFMTGLGERFGDSPVLHKSDHINCYPLMHKISSKISALGITVVKDQRFLSIPTIANTFVKC